MSVAACTREPPCSFLPVAAESPDRPSAGSPFEIASARGRGDFRTLVPRLHSPSDLRSTELLYEMSNPPMRRESGEEDGPATLAGQPLADHWRKTIAGVRGVFVLRDSLYSQQDHAFVGLGHGPHAPMLPPAWIAAAVADVGAGIPLRPLCPPPLDANRAWSEISADDLFGSFPPSPTLFRIARGRPFGDGARPAPSDVRGARAMLRALAVEVSALGRAQAQGPDAVARAGAERISRSDRRFFGAELRRTKVIPILVENPSATERREGKGLIAVGRSIAPRWLHLTRHRLLERRLVDGHVAIERYDLGDPDAAARALEIVVELLRAAPAPGGKVWLWMETAARPLEEVCNGDEEKHVRAFRARAGEAGADLARLAIVRKPDLELPTMSAGTGSALRATLRRCAALEIFLPVRLRAEELRPWIEARSLSR